MSVKSISDCKFEVIFAQASQMKKKQIRKIIFVDGIAHIRARMHCRIVDQFGFDLIETFHSIWRSEREAAKEWAHDRVLVVMYVWQ